jgi:hypothetical protein
MTIFKIILRLITFYSFTSLWSNGAQQWGDATHHVNNYPNSTALTETCIIRFIHNYRNGSKRELSNIMDI